MNCEEKSVAEGSVKCLLAPSPLQLERVGTLKWGGGMDENASPPEAQPCHKESLHSDHTSAGLLAAYLRDNQHSVHPDLF